MHIQRKIAALLHLLEDDAALESSTETDEYRVGAFIVLVFRDCETPDLPQVCPIAKFDRNGSSARPSCGPGHWVGRSFLGAERLPRRGGGGMMMFWMKPLTRSGRSSLQTILTGVYGRPNFGDGSRTETHLTSH